MVAGIEPLSLADVSFDENIVHSKAYDDVYFSKAGGISEAEHVFINGNQLPTRFNDLNASAKPSFIIGELGFGTGLNFLLTMKLWNDVVKTDAVLHYVACEKHPFCLEDLKRVHASFTTLTDESRQLLSHYPCLTPGMHRLWFGRVCLTLMLGDGYQCLKQLLSSNHIALHCRLRAYVFDVWYLDGFKVKNNDELWSLKLFKVMHALSTTTTTISSYSVAKTVIERLEEAGFDVAKEKGFAAKRHMLVGRCRLKETNSDVAKPTGNTYLTPWHMPEIRTPTKSSATVAIIGAGMAGCMVANTLARRGYRVYLFDRHGDVAKGASGNSRGLLSIRVPMRSSPIFEFMLTCYMFAARFYRDMHVTNGNGMLYLALTEKEKKRQNALKHFFLTYPSLGQCVSADEASIEAGVSTSHEAILFHDACVIDINKLCRQLIDHKNVNFIAESNIPCLVEVNGGWQVDTLTVDKVVLANGHNANEFEQTLFLPIIDYPGEVGQIKASRASGLLKRPLCHSHYLFPAEDGRHLMAISNKSADDSQSINQMSKDFSFSEKDILSRRLSIRAATADYFPFVGPVPIEKSFISSFAVLTKDRRAFVSQGGDYYNSLYVLTGLGSHGLCYSPLCAELIVSFINNEPLPLTTEQVRHLSPARALIKAIVQQVGQNN